MRVSGTAPDDTGVVSNPRYMLVDIIHKRAKPLLTCVAPKCERKGLHFRASPVAALFPKSHNQSDQSVRRAGNAHSLPKRKLSLLDLFLSCFGLRLAGLIQHAILHRVAGFLILIFLYGCFLNQPVK